MHLYEARVDFDGQTVPLGYIRFDDDDQGVFVCPAHSCLQLTTDQDNIICLQVATAERDVESGFLVTEIFGPRVYLPKLLSSFVLDALPDHFAQVRRVELSGQEGSLYSAKPIFTGAVSPAPGSEIGQRDARRQPLSNWALEIVPEIYGYKFRLSAALLALEPFYDWDKAVGNFWPAANGRPRRLSIEFTVDSATRVAVFGAGLPDIDRESALGPGTLASGIERTTLGTAKLSNARIDVQGQAFGFTANGALVRLHERKQRAPSLTLELVQTPQVQPHGFVVSGYPQWPRITLKGFDLRTIHEMMEMQSRPIINLEFRDGWFGEAEQHRGSYENPNRCPNHYIKDCNVRFSLDGSGLSIYYQAFVNDWKEIKDSPFEPAWIKGSVLIPWEILILRYPKFLRQRQNILSSTPSDLPG